MLIDCDNLCLALRCALVSRSADGDGERGLNEERDEIVESIDVSLELMVMINRTV